MQTARTLFFISHRHTGGTSDCWRGESRQLSEGDFGRFLPQTGHGLKNVPASLLLFCVKNPYFVRAAKSTALNCRFAEKTVNCVAKRACCRPRN